MAAALRKSDWLLFPDRCAPCDHARTDHRGSQCTA
jgi:hypothetical protein